MIYAIRQTAYTVFALTFFLVFAAILTVEGFVLLTLRGKTDENKLKYHRKLQRIAWFVINHVPGTKFSYSNPDNETFDKPAVIICNHQSHLDLMGVMMLTPKVVILTKDWVWRNPFYGLIIRYADYFPVSEMENMVGKLSEMIAKGYSVVVFPEGTRSEDCSILRFHRGAFYMAEQLKLDIVPVFIKGFGTVLPKKSMHLHPGEMSLEVMPRLHRDNESEISDYRTMTKSMRKVYIEKNS